MPPSDRRSYDSLAIDTSNYVIAVCFTQRRIPFLAASWMAERLCKRLSYFIDGNLETHAHYTSFFPIWSLLNSKIKPKPEILLCLWCQTMYTNVWMYTQTYICVYKKRIRMIYVCFPLFLHSSKLASAQLHNIWSFVVNHISF